MLFTSPCPLRQGSNNNKEKKYFLWGTYPQSFKYIQKSMFLWFLWLSLSCVCKLFFNTLRKKRGPFVQFHCLVNPKTNWIIYSCACHVHFGFFSHFESLKLNFKRNCSKTVQVNSLKLENRKQVYLFPFQLWAKALSCSDWIPVFWLLFFCFSVVFGLFFFFNN